MYYKSSLIKSKSLINSISVRNYCDALLPKESKVIIYGNELTSKSIAYHLSLKLSNNCIVINGKSSKNVSKTITGINSCHINHLIVANPRISLLIKYSTDLYDVNTCGAIYLAQNHERVNSFKRMISASKLLNTTDINSIELLSAEELKRRYDYLNVENIKCGLYVPFDGIIDDINAQELKLQKLAENNGVKFYDNYILKKININNDRVSNVELINCDTNQLTRIDCEYFVNSANNYWTRVLGKRSVTKVRIPTLCCEHQVMETKPFDLVNDKSVPILHDFDSRSTAYQRNDRSFCLTGYQKVSKVIQQKIIDDDKSGAINIEIPEVEENWDNFYHILNPILNRIPGMGSAKLHKLHARPENFTPDGRSLIGEVPEVRNYLLAAAVVPQLSGAAGKLIADIITRSDNSFGHDFWSLDPRRFIPLHSNRVFLFDRLREIPAKMRYNINYPTPHHDYETGHGLRVSPIYPRLQEVGALFSQIMGYERPAVYINTDNYDSEPIDKLNIRHRILETPSFGRPHWLEAVQEEYQACRERVALLDYCSFTKLELKSPNDEVVELLQYLCSNDIDVNVGSIVHTGMQNERGGYESDISLIRLAENKFMLIGPTEQQSRCLSWIKRHNMDSTVQINDISSIYTAICVMGPLSKMVLSDVLTDSDQLESFPFFTYKELGIGLASKVRVCNLTHTGELGWVLYIPNEHALHVYDLLVRVGEKYGLRHAGSIAMRTLRIEKFFAFWGQDLDTTTTPLECGRSFRVKFDKEFLGKSALLKQKEEGVRRRYVQLVIEDFNSSEPIWPWGGEPIFLCDNDIPVGLTTTTGYGFTLLRHVCLGFIRHPENKVITNDFILKSKFEVEIGGKRFKARTNIHSPKLTDVSGTYLATR